jgi:branched-chain amino acid transport system substrate-binding protein
MRNIICSVICICICLSTASIAYTESEARAVRLGAVVPLSGDLAHYGNEIKNGMQLAQEQSEYPVKLFFEDAPPLGHKIMSGFNQLVSIDQIDGIAGNFSNQAMLSMAPGIERLQLPAFHTAAADEQILAASDWVLTTNVRISDEARKVAEHMHAELGFRRVAVLAAETSFGQGYRKAFVARFKELGGEIVADQIHSVTDSDMRTLISKIRLSKPEAIFLGTFGSFLGNAVRQIKQQGIKAPLFTVYEAEDQSVIDSAGTSALEGIRYYVSYTSQRQFEDLYLARFKHMPSTFARNSYDATRLLTQGNIECAFERICVKNWLYRVKNFQGVSGTFDIESDGGTKKKLFMHEFRDGKFQSVVDYKASNYQ